MRKGTHEWRTSSPWEHTRRVARTATSSSMTKSWLDWAPRYRNQGHALLRAWMLEKVSRPLSLYLI
jgi:hypothetical protein